MEGVLTPRFGNAEFGEDVAGPPPVGTGRQTSAGDGHQGGSRAKPVSGLPWSLPLADRALLVAAWWRTNLTMRQLAIDADTRLIVVVGRPLPGNRNDPCWA